MMNNKKQIKKELKKKINKWHTVLLLNAAILHAASLLFLHDSPSIESILFFILSTINLFGFVIFSIYLFDYIEERYEDYIKREEYFKKQTLKDKILDFLIILWFAIPFLLILGLSILVINFLIGVIYEVSLILLWFIIPFLFNENKESKKDSFL